MAVYYKWIKGCQAGAKLASTEGTSDAGLWTYLKWGTGTTGIDQMPTLYTNVGKNDETQTGELGYLLTSNMPSPTISNPWFMKQNLFFVQTTNQTGNIEPNEDGSIQHGEVVCRNFGLEVSSFGVKNDNDVLAKPLYFWGNYNKFGGTSYFGMNLNPKAHGTEGAYTNQSVEIRLQNGTPVPATGVGADTSSVLKVLGTAFLSPRYTPGGDAPLTEVGCISLVAEGGVCLGSNVLGADKGSTASFPGYADGGNIVFTKKLEVKNKPIDAQYFNATSDKRAKENIQPATYSALELIKKLPVYIYNYKNSSENVTGILAQDLLEAQPKELDLVSNINATGENNDYMSIKNDKLMFVLMKAIQEQQEQIERLESEIAKLKNLI